MYNIVNVASPLELNRVGANLWSYNCGGFATGRNDWLCPRGWEDWAYDIDNPDCMEYAAEQFLKCCPNFHRVKSPRGVSSSKRVVGYRVASSDRRGWGQSIDLHFIVRKDGVWYEKMGGGSITLFDQRPMGEWDYGYRVYDSPILWFVDDAEDTSAYVGDVPDTDNLM